MASADGVLAVAQILRDDSALLKLLGGDASRILVDDLTDAEVKAQPRSAVLCTASGGSRDTQGLPIVYQNVDVRCYGQNASVGRALALAARHVLVNAGRQSVTNSTIFMGARVRQELRNEYDSSTAWRFAIFRVEVLVAR